MKTLLRISAVFILGASWARAGDRLVIHEWGTLTSLEDEKGELLAGINADDEPVPAFVHGVLSGLVLPPTVLPTNSKYVPRVHPDVTVRLETPVLYVHAPPGFAGPLDVSVKYPGGWLTEFYPDAKAEAPGIDLTNGQAGHLTDQTVGTLHWQGLKIVGPSASSRPFNEGDYSAANIVALRASLEAALIQAGLYRDEAEALLDTWEVSYFKSPGLRAFYLMPRACVDLLLPLTISPKAEITRVMVGRIELATPEQRAVMARIGTSKTEEAGQLYSGLGRFRNALLLDEERRRPTPGLEQFMQNADVAFYRPR